jgi:type I restriction enzyme, S subunit
MNTYSSYKDSGVDWIGNIPSDWEVVRNKYLFDVTKNVVGEESDKYQLLSLTKRGVVLRDIESGKGKFPESFDTYQTVDKGDLIFCLYDIDETPRTIGISNYSGMITGSYKVVKCNTLTDPKFIYYNYLSIDDVKGLRPYYTGLRKVVRTETFLNLNVRVPSLQEQQQISDYLDYKTLKIDKLIEKTEQKIELLKEQRTSLINTTVTKGLDPNVEMKDSGVEWIGKIPSEWNTISLRYYLIRVGSGSTPRGGGDVYSDNGIPFLRSQNVHFDGLHLEGVVFISEEIHQNMNNTIVKHGDVLLNITGGSIGRSCVVDTHEEMNVNQHVSILRTKESLINFYLNYCLVSSIGQEQVDYNQTGGNREGLSSDNIKNFKFVLPPLQEQQLIVDYINKKNSKIDKLVDIESKRIILLKEYRQSLISDVVTGKVDIRSEVLV